MLIWAVIEGGISDIRCFIYSPNSLNKQNEVKTIFFSEMENSPSYSIGLVFCFVFKNTILSFKKRKDRMTGNQ